MIDNDMGLGAYDDAYDNVKILDRKVEIPDGQYNVLITDAILDRDKDKRPLFTLVMEVEDGDQAGVILPLDSSFYDDTKLKYFKKAMIGLSVGHLRPSDIQNGQTRAAFVGMRANITCATKAGNQGGRFLNIYINRRIDTPAQPARPAAPAPSKVVGSIQPPASKPAPFDDSELPF